METGYDKAIRLAGGPSRLAALLSAGKPKAKRVTAQTVCNWKSRGVPVRRCPEVERALGGQVTCAELQPAIFGDMTTRKRSVDAAHRHG